MNLYLFLPFVNMKFEPSKDFFYSPGLSLFSFRVCVTGVTAHGTRTGVSWVGSVRYTSRLRCNVATKYGLKSAGWPAGPSGSRLQKETSLSLLTKRNGLVSRSKYLRVLPTSQVGY
jgi:hypothetical protein